MRRSHKSLVDIELQFMELHTFKVQIFSESHKNLSHLPIFVAFSEYLNLKINFCSSIFLALRLWSPKGNNLIDYYKDKGLHRFELQTYLHFGVRDIILHSIRERLSRYWPIVILSRLHRDAICALALALGIIFISAYMRVSNLEAIFIL